MNSSYQSTTLLASNGAGLSLDDMASSKPLPQSTFTQESEKATQASYRILAAASVPYEQKPVYKGIEENSHILSLKVRKLQLSLQNKSLETQRLKQMFQEAQKQNTEFVIQLQDEVEQIRTKFLEKERALDETASYFSVPLSKANPTQFTKFDLRSFMVQLLSNLLKLQQHSMNVRNSLENFSNEKQQELKMTKITTTVDLQSNFHDLSFHDIVRKINEILGNTKQIMQTSNTRAKFSMKTYQSNLKPAFKNLVNLLQTFRSEIDFLKRQSLECMQYTRKHAIEATKRVNSEWSKKYRHLEQIENNKTKSIEKLEQTLRTTKDRCTETSTKYEVEFQRLYTNIEGLQSQNSGLEIEIDSLKKSKHEEAAKLKSDFEGKMLTTASENVSYFRKLHDEKAAQFQAVINDKNSKLALLQQKLDHQRTQNANKHDQLHQQVESCKAELSFVEAARSQLQKLLTQKEDELSKLRQQCQNTNEAQLKTSNNLQRVQNEAAELQQNLNKMQALIKKQTTQLKLHEKVMGTDVSIKSKLTEENQSLQKKLVDFVGEVSKLRKDNNELEAKNKKLLQNLHLATEKNKLYKDDSTSLKKALDLVETGRNQGRIELISLRDKNTILIQQLKSAKVRSVLFLCAFLSYV